MTRLDLMKIEKNINDTRVSGDEISPDLESPLKTILMDDILTAMGNKDPQTRAAAHKVSKMLLACDDSHKRRILERMSKSDI